ncbi:hypothetical protein BRD00_00395 [Halobacteriales archaeon QS_8_69_26]|nr:MAG: hypothetical protein BRD00_00395 [Halobacteriales archaeon QS_8_69_26]
MSSDNSRETVEEHGQTGVSRRDFARAAGATALIGGLATGGGSADGTSPARDLAAPGDVTPIGESYTPGEWLTIGPFQYQRRDTSVGSLFPLGGSDDVSEGQVAPSSAGELQSAFAGGSELTWERVTASGSTVGFPQALDEIDPTGGDLTPLTNVLGTSPGLFDDVQDWFGVGGALYGKGYAFTTFEVDGPKRAVLETDSTVWLNGHKHEESPKGVVLRDGTNYLLASTFLFFGFSGSVSIEFRPPRAPVEVNDPDPFRGIPQNVVAPDLQVGEETDLPASVRVTNTTAEPVSDATLTFAPESDHLVEQEVDVDPPLAPFETRRINTRVQTSGGASTQGEGGNGPGALGKGAKDDARTGTDRSEVPARSLTTVPPGDGVDARREAEAVKSTADGPETRTLVTERDVLDVVVRASVAGQSDEQSVELRVADEDANRIMTTFESAVDGSVQYFTYRLPANVESSSGPYDAVFSLHGANVNSWNQAGANLPRDDAYVVAPDARGPVNYDHEDLGRIDDLEALDVALERFDIDENRVYISGHSMGGHGTWHVGLTNSERFAAMAPSAGWTDHETYITTVWGRDKLHTFPGLKAVKETALQKNLAMPKTENVRDGNTPIFVLQGGKDTSVPSIQPRSYVRTLRNRGLDVDGEVGRRHRVTPDDTDVAYLEVPGQGHYWDDGIGPGTDTVNHPDMFEFVRSAENDPYPEEVTLFTTNLRVEDSKHWVTVREQEQVHAPTKVHARVTSGGIDLETENVAQLEVDTRVLGEADTAAHRRVRAGGDTARLPGRGTAVVDLTGGGVSARPANAGDPNRPRTKDADQYGPMKEVHHDPYRLVYGTQGSDAETAMNRNLANIRSGRLVSRARAPATVVPDTAVDRETVAEYNLVLFGRPSSNAVYGTMANSFPVKVRDGEVRIRDQSWTGDLAVSFLYPNPRNEDRLVQVETGTSMAGARLTRVRDWTPTQTAAADYMVFDESVRYQKWNACLAAGYFDKHWNVDESLSYHRTVDR